MKEAEAQGKVCPFMSKPVQGIVMTPGIEPMPQLFWQYCLASQCMSWESNFTGLEPAEGYCKLMEEINGTIY